MEQMDLVLMDLVSIDSVFEAAIFTLGILFTESMDWSTLLQSYFGEINVVEIIFIWNSQIIHELALILANFSVKSLNSICYISILVFNYEILSLKL